MGMFVPLAHQLVLEGQVSDVDTQVLSSSLGTHRTSLHPERTSYTYLHLLNRISGHSPESPSDRLVMEKVRYDDLIELLLRQPPEISQLILGWLEPRDLLSLRLTSHTLHNLIHDSERAICVSLADRVSKVHNLHHLPMPAIDLSTFFKISRQYGAICKVSTLLATRISNYTTLRTLPSNSGNDVEFRKNIIPRLEGRIARALVILQRYMDFVLQTIVENERCLADLDNEDYASLFNIFDLDQQHFLAEHMSGMTEADFVDVTACFNIFKSICKVRHIPFSFKPYMYVSMKQVFVLKGFVPFVALLSPEITSDKQVITLQPLCENIGQPKSASMTDRHPTIHHLTGYHQSLEQIGNPRRNRKVQETFISHQDLWDRAARALMMQKLGRFPAIKTPTVWLQDVIGEDEKMGDLVLGSWDKMERT